MGRLAGCGVYCLSDNEEMESVGVQCLSMEALTSGAKGLHRTRVCVCVCVSLLQLPSIWIIFLRIKQLSRGKLHLKNCCFFPPTEHHPLKVKGGGGVLKLILGRIIFEANAILTICFN